MLRYKGRDGETILEPKVPRKATPAGPDESRGESKVLCACGDKEWHLQKKNLILKIF